MSTTAPEKSTTETTFPFHSWLQLSTGGNLSAHEADVLVEALEKKLAPGRQGKTSPGYEVARAVAIPGPVAIACSICESDDPARVNIWDSIVKPSEGGGAQVVSTNGRVLFGYHHPENSPGYSVWSAGKSAATRETIRFSANEAAESLRRAWKYPGTRRQREDRKPPHVTLYALSLCPAGGSDSIQDHSMWVAFNRTKTEVLIGDVHYQHNNAPNYQEFLDGISCDPGASHDGNTMMLGGDVLKTISEVTHATKIEDAVYEYTSSVNIDGTAVILKPESEASPIPVLFQHLPGSIMVVMPKRGQLVAKENSSYGLCLDDVKWAFRNASGDPDSKFISL